MGAETPSTRSMPLVSVCVLNFNGVHFVRRCLEKLFATTYPSFEILVVDNASTDESESEIRATLGEAPAGLRVQFTRQPTNRGYAAGHNAATRLARGEYFAFVNSTCFVEPDWLDIVPWMERHGEVGFAQPLIAFPELPPRIQSLGSRMSPAGYLDVLGNGVLLEAIPASKAFDHEVFSVHGSAFVARRRSFEALGGFDERMFLYFEESDLCWRGWLRGIPSACYHDPTRSSRVFHQVHGTAPPQIEIDRLFDRNRTLSMLRNLSAGYLPYALFNSIVVTSELCRHPRTLARYWWDVLRALPSTGGERRAIQNDRTVPDRRIFGISVPEHVRALRERSGPEGSTGLRERT